MMTTPPFTPEELQTLCEEVFEDLSSTSFIDQYLERNFEPHRRAAIKDWLKGQENYDDLDLVLHLDELREVLEAEWKPFRN